MSSLLMFFWFFCDNMIDGNSRITFAVPDDDVSPLGSRNLLTFSLRKYWSTRISDRLYCFRRKHLSVLRSNDDTSFVRLWSSFIISASPKVDDSEEEDVVHAVDDDVDDDGGGEKEEDPENLDDGDDCEIDILFVLLNATNIFLKNENEKIICVACIPPLKRYKI